ncbi:putative sugar transferase EpsL [Rhodobacteraceae bacterium THAF1]|uniref:sugar transferase n=1 Tax=Palleronia sp. THAF1 TaxID=2587842 RepID=UPI000F3F302A|nr:sugar transferase [Palleronia sp. THAF1]QFU10344.1 putative sugar transferase EpsL [Palleronia sp. THAF1]VDC31462.1 putative sugar transferase EpsL [Rhodobacteraceae bacterium THAF1]
MPRTVEIILTVALLVCVAPLAVAVAIAVRAELGRPILFRQIRSGQWGERIAIYKFRSMTDARDAAGALLPDAARTGRVGHTIRRFRLDEIPQLLSILRGDTALVGPRPLLEETVREFDLAGEARGAVRPGLTGWAQVNGNSRLANVEKICMDLWYVYRRDTWLDFRILWLTLVTLVRGETRSERRIAAACAWLKDGANFNFPPEMRRHP